jgi:peptidoglycan/LPS O-acetylase OafA/YrhL
VGKMSYGLYVWHSPLFLLVQTRAFPFAAELAIELTLTTVVTLASFYLLEKPLLRLKERLKVA